MFSCGVRSLPYRFQLLVASLQMADSLPFADALSQEQIQSVCNAHGMSCGEEEIYTPAITLWGFLSQVIQHKVHRSCAAAVARIGKLLMVTGRPNCSPNTGPYCRARGQLPVGVIEDLATSVAVQCEEESPEEWLWFGRSVELVDGTTVTMPDTEENQEKYPQQSCQKEGLGFPIARMVVVLSLATCMLRGLKMGSYQGKKTGETSLLRQLLDKFQPNSIALLDKLFCNYWTLAEFLDRQVDVVTLLNPTRKVDLSRASRLGKNDYLITWERPKRPSWMDAETYAKIPETLSLRLIQSQVTQPGFRTTSLTIITTLTDADCYKSDDVVALYRMRWHAEVYQPECTSSALLYQLAARD